MRKGTVGSSLEITPSRTAGSDGMNIEGFVLRVAGGMLSSDRDSCWKNVRRGPVYRRSGSY